MQQNKCLDNRQSCLPAFDLLLLSLLELKLGDKENYQMSILKELQGKRIKDWF